MRSWYAMQRTVNIKVVAGVENKRYLKEAPLLKDDDMISHLTRESASYSRNIEVRWELKLATFISIGWSKEVQYLE